jgi:hypothetical protein
MQKEVPPNNPNTSITHSQILPLLRGVYKRLRAFAFRIPYAAFLLWPTICFYYSIYSYQPYRVFLVRIIIYALINLIVYGLAYLLAGSRERATVGTVLFFVSPWLLPERVQVFWKVHPEALLIPIIIFPLLRLLRIGRRINRVIHLTVAMLMILLHFRLGLRWMRNHYYYGKPFPAECASPTIRDTSYAYPDIYCLVFDAFGHPDTLRKYLNIPLSYPNKLTQEGFAIASIHTPVSATLYTLYHFLSPNGRSYYWSPSTFFVYMDQWRVYDIVAYTSLPLTLRERGYNLTGPLPAYYALQSMPCFSFHSYNNIFDLTFPYDTRWRTFAWHYITLSQKIDLPIQENPTFYYYHLLTSHFPYVFDTNGHYYRSPGNDMTNLRTSFIYTEKVLLRLIDDIRKSRQGNPRPYAILLFSDHGPNKLTMAPYYMGLDTARIIVRSAFAALYTSWELPDSIRQAFLQAANHQDLGRIVLQIANPVSKQVSAPRSPMEGP